MKKKTALPSPLTNLDSTTSSVAKEGTITPPSPVQPRQLLSPTINDAAPSQTCLDSQTQPFSQLNFPLPAHNYQVEDEEAERVWGYLVPIDAKSTKFGALVLKERQICKQDDSGPQKPKEDVNVSKLEYINQEKNIEKQKSKGLPSKGYLVGRHPECGQYILSSHVVGKINASQISELIILRYRIDIAYYSRNQKVETFMEFWRIHRETALLSMIHWLVGIIDENYATAMRLVFSK